MGAEASAEMIEVQIPDRWMKTIHRLARERDTVHQDHATSRPLSDNYEVIGFAGEYAFHSVCALMADWGVRPGGDSGVDFVVGRQTIDVKTARKPFNLIVERGKIGASIYVLAGFIDPNIVNMYGWETSESVAEAPTKDFGYGITNHYIPRDNLRPMETLVAHIDRWRSD